MGLGFALPSLYGAIQPVQSALLSELELGSQVAVDQYRSMSILVLMLGALICYASLKAETIRFAIISATFLVGALLFSRCYAMLLGEITPRLLIETALETIAFVVLLWDIRSRKPSQQ